MMRYLAAALFALLLAVSAHAGGVFGDDTVSWRTTVSPAPVIAAGTGNAAGTADVSGVGAQFGIAPASGLAAGTSNVLGPGFSASIAAGAGRATGGSAVAGVGAVLGTGALGTGAATGTANVAGTSASLAATAGNAAASSAGAGTGASLVARAGGADGTSSSAGTGAALSAGAGNSTGSSNVSGSASSVALTGAGNAAGTSNVAGVGASIAKSAGAVTAAGAAAGVGWELARGSGAANGTATGAGTGASIAKSAGASTGTASASGVGRKLAAGAGAANGAASVTGVAYTSSGSTEVPFTAVHTYYLSPTGDDNNYDGLSPTYTSGTHGPWFSPNHAVQCGDVIIAKAAAYTAGTWGTAFGTNNWGVVSNCPSNSGGLDGSGGIQFAILLCAGPKLGACTVNGGTGAALRPDKSHWAVEGFVVSQNADAGEGCASATSEADNDVTLYTAFINDMAVHCGLQGFGSFGWATNSGADMTAVVGTITYDASPSLTSGVCGSGISMIPANGSVTSSGTHIFVAGNFGYRNINAPSGAGCNTDGEGVIFDSWSCLGATAYQYQGVVEQNVWWGNGSSGFEAFPNCTERLDKSKVYVFGNTSYGNLQDPQHGLPNDKTNTSPVGELVLQKIAPTVSDGTIYSITNNIFMSIMANAGGDTSAPYGAAVNIWTENSTMPSVDVSGNYIYQSVTSYGIAPHSSAGANNTDVNIGSTSYTNTFPLGTNTYADPVFASPGGLPTTEPDCSAYDNTTDCMLTGYGIYTHLTPTASGAVSKGYHPPGACAPDPYFPTWLVGIVYLHWTGTGVVQRGGLITKPCGV